MKSYNELKMKSDEFFTLCQNRIAAKPWAVCIAMHEYNRNLYPSDPYIPYKEDICPTERIYNNIEQLLSFLGKIDCFGAYSMDLKKITKINDVREKTAGVYGKLWNKFSFEQLTRKATQILRERLSKNNFDLAYFRGKHALDIGCGSGRFSYALKKLGCLKVTGVDCGREGLKIAGTIAKKSGVKGLFFKKADILSLPFRDNSFDFIFCNGALHHTENLEQGIREMVRVAKPRAKMWLYLYGDGGLFWYARKRMPAIMKKIPQTYTMAVLDLIGAPQDRFIFIDNWYVPIEQHTTDAQARNIFSRFGIGKITRIEKGRSTDLDYLAIHGGEMGKILYGDGELRYILEK